MKDKLWVAWIIVSEIGCVILLWHYLPIKWFVFCLGIMSALNSILSKFERKLDKMEKELYG